MFVFLSQGMITKHSEGCCNCLVFYQEKKKKKWNTFWNPAVCSLLLMPIFPWNNSLKMAIFIALLLLVSIFLEINQNRGTQSCYLKQLGQVPCYVALLRLCIFVASNSSRFKISLAIHLHVTGPFNFDRTISKTSRKVLEMYPCAF